MRSSRFALVVGAMALLGGGVAFGAGANRPTLASPNKAQKAHKSLKHTNRNIQGASELLFRGDMSANIGLGCSNGSGTAGGPNDWATKITSSIAPPFGIVSTTYNIFTFNSGPTWDVVAWANGASPGAEIARVSLGAANGTLGDHTVVVPWPSGSPITTNAFFFGLSQGADVSGIRIGMDTDGSTAGTTFIKAPGCGLGAFGTVEAIGYPGFWVQSVLIDQTFPVELMNFSVS